MNAPSPLHDPKVFKFFALQERKAISLLREIVWRWRRSSAYVPRKGGKWAAYPRETWRDWLGGVSKRTLDRSLKTLLDNGLIDRERHRFAGSNVCAFIRPTELALKYLGRDDDLEVLAASKMPMKNAASDASVGATQGVSIGAINGATDHTSFSSLSSTQSTQKKASTQTHAGGKGKAGEQPKKKLKLTLMVAPKALQPLMTSADDDDVAAILNMKTKKQTKLLAKFPPLSGAHEKFVKHPSLHFGDEWFGWSLAKQVESYGWYQKMVDNWYVGKNGKAYKPLSYDDVEFELDLDIPDIEEELGYVEAKQAP